MKILHAYKVYHPYRGGVVSAIDALRADVTNRHEVLAARGNRTRDVHVTGALFDLLSMPIAPTWPFRLWAMQDRYDIIDVHLPFPLADLSLFLRRPRKARIVVHWHSAIIAQKRVARVLQPILRNTLVIADAIIVSTEGAIEYSPELHEFRDKIHVVPFSIDAGEFRSRGSSGDVADIDLPDRFALFAGRLVPYKGLDCLLDAAGSCSMPVVIAGEGPQQEALHARIEHEGLQEKVLLLGAVSDAEMSALMQAATCFVLPSISPAETFGIVQLEAMACGLPVINTDAHPGIGSVARHEEEALTVAAGDAVALASALDRMLNDVELRERLGRNSLQRVESRFSDKIEPEKMRNIYASVMQSSGQS